MSFLQVGLVGQPRFAATELAVHSIFARAVMSAPIEGAEQSPTGPSPLLIFLPAESADTEMFVRADTSAPIMEDANLVVHAALGMVAYARWEMSVRVERVASETDVLHLSFLPVVPANSEMFVRPDISVSMAGAM